MIELQSNAASFPLLRKYEINKKNNYRKKV